MKKLSETPAPSGYEQRIVETIREYWHPLVDEINVDRVGNLVAIKKGSGKQPRHRLLLAAHMDEIGLIVKAIERFPDEAGGNGFLRVTNVGGADRRQMYGQKVIVHSTGGRDLLGIIGSLPANMLPGSVRTKSFGYDELLVDVGLSYDSLVEEVSIGDFISFHQPVRKLLNRRIVGKALDNRAAVAATTFCLDQLSGREHEWDVLAVATTQEETTLLGAHTSAFSLQPDIAIAIDVTHGKGPGVKDDVAYELNGGPVLGLGSNVHPGIFRRLSDAASAIEMTFQIEPHQRFSGTDAAGLQIAREGIPTGLVEIPLRYMHTSVESIALADIERVGRLSAEFISRLDSETLSEIVAEMMD
jgi:endoglucanase